MFANKTTPGRILFNMLNFTGLIILTAVTLYPFLYVLAASVSDSIFITRGEVGIIPKGFNLQAYKAVLSYPMIARSYGNTVFYTTAGTAINLVLTVCGAYALSRQKFYGRNFFTFFIVFTMLFSGGLIPNFLVVKSLGLYNTYWAMLLPGAISSWNLVVMRTFFQQIPPDMEEAGIIDGCNDIQILFKIFLPLSIPSLMTIGLFYAVGHWNSFFNALIYLKDRNLYPIQIMLRQVVIMNEAKEMTDSMAEYGVTFRDSVKFATIMVATLPILLVYPFIQKYFVKGAMVGALKG